MGNKKVLVKFKSNWSGGPVIMTVPEERVSTLSTMDDVDWVSTTDASQYFTSPIRTKENKALSRETLAKAVSFMRDNHKIQAIKEVRLGMNCSLKEAKDLCDELDLQFNLTPYVPTNPRPTPSYTGYSYHDSHLDDDYPYHDEPYRPDPF